MNLSVNHGNLAGPNASICRSIMRCTLGMRRYRDDRAAKSSRGQRNSIFSGIIFPPNAQV
jgi:hypothetical protein